MRRREFIAGLGSAAAWPLVARAQQGDRVRRISVLVSAVENDVEYATTLAAFRQALADLGWIEGRNLRMDIRWTAGSVDRARAYAKELVDLQPDVIVSETTPLTAALQSLTQTIPIVFALATRLDPVSWRAWRGPAGISPASLCWNHR